MNEQIISALQKITKWKIHSESELLGSYTTKAGETFCLFVNQNGRVQLYESSSKLLELNSPAAASFYAEEAPGALADAIKRFTDDFVEAK